MAGLSGRPGHRAPNRPHFDITSTRSNPSHIQPRRHSASRIDKPRDVADLEFAGNPAALVRDGLGLATAGTGPPTVIDASPPCFPRIFEKNAHHLCRIGPPAQLGKESSQARRTG